MSDYKMKQLRTKLVALNIEGITQSEWQELKSIIDDLFKSDDDDEKITRKQVDKLRDLCDERI